MPSGRAALGAGRPLAHAGGDSAASPGGRHETPDRINDNPPDGDPDPRTPGDAAPEPASHPHLSPGKRPAASAYFPPAHLAPAVREAMSVPVGGGLAMRVLVAAASKRGATEEIAERIAAIPLVVAAGSRGHALLAGMLDWRHLRLAERAVATALRAPDGDLRDGVAIDARTGHIDRRLRGA